MKKRINVGNEGKTVAKNFGYLSLLQVANYVFPFITMPYLSRVIGVEGFGKVAFGMAVITWVQTVTDWGFNFTATRDIAQNRDNKEYVSDIFSNVLWARILLMLISAVFLKIAIELLPFFKENEVLLWATFLMIPGHICFPEWFFQGMERMKYTTCFTLLVKLLFTIAVFLFIKERNDYIYQPLLNAFGYIASGMISMYFIIVRWGYSFRKPNFLRIFKTIKNGTDVFINTLMPNLYNSFSVMLLGMYGGADANGIYDGGSKFVGVFRQLQHVISRTFFPFLSRRPDKHSLFARLNLMVSVIGVITIWIFAPLLIRYMLGTDFMASVPILRILSISLIFMALNNTYGTNYLIIYHHERILRNNTIVASLIGFILAFPLVKYYTYYGAAFVIVISRGLLGILAFISAKKIMKRSE